MGCAGHTEVHHLDLPVVRDEHVLRADIAVHDIEGFTVEPLELMGVVQAVERIRQYLELRLQRQGVCRPQPSLHAAPGLPIQVLHREIEVTVIFAGPIGVHDVRMGQAGREACLVQK